MFTDYFEYWDIIYKRKEKLYMIKRYKQNEIDELADILKKDGVTSVPTDTVYGVCARINSIKAHDKLVRINGRCS